MNLWKYFVASWAMGDLNYSESGRKCEIYQNKGTQGRGFDEKFLPGGRNLTKLDNLHQGCGGM